MLRFVRNVENWGGVQGTSWVASTEIAAMSLSLRMRFDAAARVGPGTGTGAGDGAGAGLCIFGRRREESEIRLGMGAWVWEFGIYQKSGSARRGKAEKKERQELAQRGWRRKREGVTQQRRRRGGLSKRRESLSKVRDAFSGSLANGRGILPIHSAQCSGPRFYQSALPGQPVCPTCNGHAAKQQTGKHVSNNAGTVTSRYSWVASAHTVPAPYHPFLHQAVPFTVGH